MNGDAGFLFVWMTLQLEGFLQDGRNFGRSSGMHCQTDGFEGCRVAATLGCQMENAFSNSVSCGQMDTNKSDVKTSEGSSEV